MNKRYIYFLFPAAMITVVCMLVYAEAQTILRSNANDPQIQLAHDMAQLIAANGHPDLPSATVDLASSLNTFYMVADANANPTASNAILDGEVPAIPKGVFEHAKQSGENRVTWEPKKGVRQAVVVVPFSGSSGEGYVAVGRSLKEVEDRTSKAFRLAFISWLVMMGIALVAFNVVAKRLIR